MAKDLPIQFVKTRGNTDIFLKEGSGSNKLPIWVTDSSFGSKKN